MQIPVPHVFKRYDIRGIVGEELTPELATAIGRATGTYLRRRGRADVVVGRDGRLSGPEYAARLIDGLRAAGVRVLDLGICPTPVMYFAIHHLGAGGGIAVTASHNPPEYNGFKINCGPDSLYDDAIQEIRRLIEAEDYESGDAPVERRPMLPDYAAALRQQFGELASRPKVVVDAGNGTAALVAPDLLRSLKCRVAELYCTVDGRFPNHEADPTVAGNLADLIRVVREQSADLGIAFDGDGDDLGRYPHGSFLGRDPSEAPGSGSHRGGKMLPVPCGRNSQTRREAAVLEIGALPDQGEDEGDRRRLRR